MTSLHDKGVQQQHYFSLPYMTFGLDQKVAACQSVKLFPKPLGGINQTCYMTSPCSKGVPENYYAPNFKEIGGAYCFWVVRPSVRPSFRPFVTLFDAQHNFKTMNATVLKFHIWIPHEKIADTYFFSWQDYAPFLSYGPLKKYGCNLVSKISQKLFKLEPWNLMNRLVVMSRQPD